MVDPSIPSLIVPNDALQIHMTIPLTQSSIVNQGYTYNQAGLTYNQIGVKYGGVTNVNTDIIPLLEIASSEPISLVLSNTQATLLDQGYTYNQAGLTYNQIGVKYGGVNSTDQDTVPMLETASNIIPNIISITDIYTPGTPIPPVTNKSGPGWLLYVNLT